MWITCAIPGIAQQGMIDYEVLFNPKSVAIVGATDRAGSVGLGLCKNLLEGEKQRKIYFINPNKKKVLGIKTYDKITEIKEGVDMAVIAVPARIVPQVIGETIEKGVGGVIIISAGFAEAGNLSIQEKIANDLKKAGIPLIGPNCLGLIKPKRRLNASFAPVTPRQGSIGFVSQSGALIDSVVDASLSEKYGFSTIVSLGNAAGLKIPDVLKYLDKDKETKVIVLYVEGVKQGRRFFKALKSLSKPVTALKAGKSKLGARAASSHTGSLAGKKDIYSAVFKQAGVFEAGSLTELFNMAKALAWQPRFKGRVGVVTNAGGPAVLAADYCEELGLRLAPIGQETIRKLENSEKMHPSFSRSNPLDIVGDATAERYKVAVTALLAQKDIKGLIVIQTMQIMTEAEKDAKILIEARKKYPDKPITACFMGGKLTQPSIDILENNRVPNYKDPRQAVLALRALMEK